jgi:PRTRC genetic system ThiF family protein
MNQYFGTSWSAEARLFDETVERNKRSANITISCVDSVRARKEINLLVNPKKKSFQKNWSTPYERPWYWMDLGNSQNSGQFVIGTCDIVPQPKKTETLQPVAQLKNVFQRFPEFVNQKTKETGPSCSLAEALKKQDLFINSTLVQLAMGTLWKMFREARINYHGAFLNLQTLTIAPINI